MGDFGRELRALRKQRGLSQRKLAELCGLSWTYISKVETGYVEPPSVAALLSLADALGVDSDALFLLAGKIPPDIANWLKGESVWFLKKLRGELCQRKPMNLLSETNPIIEAER